MASPHAGNAPPGVDPEAFSWFQSVDADHSGYISVKELKQALVNSNWSTFNDETCLLMISESGLSLPSLCFFILISLRGASVGMELSPACVPLLPEHPLPEQLACKGSLEQALGKLSSSKRPLGGGHESGTQNAAWERESSST